MAEGSGKRLDSIDVEEVGDLGFAWGDEVAGCVFARCTIRATARKALDSLLSRAID